MTTADVYIPPREPKRATAMTMLAVQYAIEQHNKALQTIHAAAVSDDPTLAGASLDVKAGLWVYPPEESK